MIRHARAIEANAPARFVLRHSFVVDQDPEGLGQLHRVQVGALNVLDQRHLHDLAVGRIENDGGYFVEPGELSGPPASLADDQLVSVTAPANDEWLQYALLAN